MSDLSWLNPTPHAIAVYASSPLSPAATQHSLPSRRYPLLGPDLHRLDRTSLRLAHSLDHLVGKRDQLVRHREAEHPGCLGVDDELKLRRLQDRQVHRLGTLENAPGIDAGLTIDVCQIGSVAHQPARFGEVARRICRGHRVARCQIDQLDAPTEEEGVGTDEKSVGTLAHQSSEGGVDLAAAAGIEDLSLRPDGARSRFQVLHYCFGVAGARVDEYGQTTDCADQLAQKFEPLCHQLTTEKIDPRQVAARARQAGDKTEPDRVFIDVEDDR